MDQVASGAVSGAAAGASFGPYGALIGAGIGTVGGLLQKRKANKLKPSTYLSPELTKQKNEADMMINATKYSGQQADESNVRQTSSQTFNNASKVAGGASELLNVASAIQTNQNAAMRDIGRRALMWKDSWRNTRRNIGNNISNQQNENRRQFQATKSALIGAGNQNLFNAATDAGQLLDYNNILRKKNGNNNLPPSNTALMYH